MVEFVSDIAIFVLKRDVKLHLTNNGRARSVKVGHEITYAALSLSSLLLLLEDL